tara:strand:+ start:1820 stop:1924 length:105 start_codon:yes stop_codon:yes gene_type:complete
LWGRIFTETGGHQHLCDAAAELAGGGAAGVLDEW